MKNKSFCHLHVHNEFSYLDGYGSAKAYITRAKELDFEYIALTNHGNCDGLIEFQTECDKQDIRPVLGCELYVVPDMHNKVKGERRGHMTVLVSNLQGWHKGQPGQSAVNFVARIAIFRGKAVRGNPGRVREFPCEASGQ